MPIRTAPADHAVGGEPTLDVRSLGTSHVTVTARQSDGAELYQITCRVDYWRFIEAPCLGALLEWDVSDRRRRMRVLSSGQQPEHP